MNFFQKLFQSPSIMLRLSIALCYLALGTYGFINQSIFAFIDRPYRPMLAGLLVAYGAFRLYRAINDLRND